MSDKLKKIIALMGKTGDRCIVIDNTSDTEFVVMTLGEYEALANQKEKIVELSEKDFLERINKEIALWKSAQEDESFSEWEFVPPKKENEGMDAKKNPEEEVFYFEPID